MAIIDAPQRIELVFDGKAHWFNVYRYTTPQELFTAMLKDGLEVTNERQTAHTIVYPAGEECGRMYLLDTNVATYAREATHMALGILSRDGLTTLGVSDGPPVEDQQDLASIIGTITAQLYTRTKYF